jgi:hypothetical protein
MTKTIIVSAEGDQSMVHLRWEVFETICEETRAVMESEGSPAACTRTIFATYYEQAQEFIALNDCAPDCFSAFTTACIQARNSFARSQSYLGYPHIGWSEQQRQPYLDAWDGLIGRLQADPRYRKAIEPQSS